MEYLKIISIKIIKQILIHAKEAEYQYIPLGIIGFIGFGAYYLIWHQFTPQAYENATLRIIAMLLCLGLISKNYWPKRMKRFLPIYWHLTLFYIMPFFFTFMLLKNNFTDTWIQNSMVALFFLIILVDWLELLILLVLGASLASLAYVVTPDVTYLPNNLNAIIAAYVALIGFGSLFLYNKNLHKEHLQTMQTTAASIAHEIRTPLAVISTSAKNVIKFFPAIVVGYKRAAEENIAPEKVPARALTLLAKTPSVMIRETRLMGLLTP